MCCFSPLSVPASLWSRLFPPRLHVSATNLFARIEGDEQILVYSMNLRTPQPVAMILPIPVVPRSGEEALRFVDLEGDPDFFRKLEALFLVQEPLARKGGVRLSFGVDRPKLVVHQVGSFIASYVPTIDDFDRVDERFRLRKQIWHRLGAYDDWGFAVFQLEPGRKTVHPMALRFRTRDRDRLFFPTVHVHDGKVHAAAKFDHALYFQRELATSDEPSFLRANADPRGLLLADHVRKRTLHGRLPNRDTWI